MTSLRLSALFRLLPVLILGLHLSGGSSVRAQDVATPPPATLKVLMVGNSFAQNISAYFPALAKEAGETPVVLITMKGGCSLEQHAKALAASETAPESPQARIYTKGSVIGIPATFPKNYNLLESLKLEKWDYVIIQQFSALSYKPETYEPYAHQVVDAIKKYAPQAEILVHETWAYREDDPLFKKGDFTQAKMYEELKAAYVKLAADYHLRTIPVGDAFQAARATPRWQYVPDATFDFAHPAAGAVPKQPGSLNMGWIWNKGEFIMDGHHANQAGKYLGAAVFLETLTGKDAQKLTYVPQGLAPEAAADLRRIAHETVQASKGAKTPATASAQ